MCISNMLPNVITWYLHVKCHQLVSMPTSTHTCNINISYICCISKLIFDNCNMQFIYIYNITLTTIYLCCHVYNIWIKTIIYAPIIICNIICHHPLLHSKYDLNISTIIYAMWNQPINQSTKQTLMTPLSNEDEV